jgi:fumarylacetoacetase
VNYGAADGHGVVADAGPFVVALSRLGLDAPAGLFERPSLDALLAAGPEVWASVASQLHDADLERGRVDGPVSLRLPFTVADYVDFYASIHHATRVGTLFRPDNPLMPNWRHLPVAYHGRAGTVVVSGTPVRRPCGQRGAGDFGPSQRLDFELEVGFVVGTPSVLGQPVAAADAADHVFGVVLVNDWSARDIQAWEYQPLGPFLGKSFATSVSAWVTPLADVRRVASPAQSPPPLPYLQVDGPWGLDLSLSVWRNGDVIAEVDFAEAMYWTLPQMVAHLTSNGAGLRTGDLLASGTASGPGGHQMGCLLERGDGRFLDDGDSVVLRGDGLGTGLGAVEGVVTAAGAPPGSG